MLAEVIARVSGSFFDGTDN